MNRTNLTLRALQVTLLVLGFSASATLPGCKAFKKYFAKTKWKTLKGSDGRSEIRLPGTWDKTKNINDLASIQAMHLSTASALLVFTEHKKNFAPYSLDKYSMQVRGMMKSKTKEYSEKGPTRLSVGPYKAIQYELRVTTMGFKQRMLHTCVEGSHYTHQILLWTNEKNWSKQQPLFRKIVASFREKKGPAPSKQQPVDKVALKLVKALDGRTTLQVPTPWMPPAKPNAQASIHQGDPKKNHYAAVFTTAKAKVPAKTLPSYADMVFARMKKNIQQFTASKPKALTVGSRPAQQREVSGNVGGLRLKYLVTVVDGPSHYHQVMAWSLATAWPAAKPLFHRLTHTFRLTPKTP